MNRFKKIPAVVVGIVAFLLLTVPAGYFMLGKDIEVYGANKTAWGQDLQCQIKPDSRGNLFGKPGRREVDIVCPQKTFERILLPQAESARDTASVWQHSVTKEYFIAGQMDGSTYYIGDPEPDYGTAWGVWFLIITIISAIAAVLVGYNHYCWQVPEE